MYINKMEQVKMYINNFDNLISNSLRRVNNYEITRGIGYILIQVALIIYITQIAGMLPTSTLRILNNDFFRLFILFTVLLTAQISPSIAILISIAFVVTVNKFTKNVFWEMLENTDSNMIPITTVNPVTMEPTTTMMPVMETENTMMPVMETENTMMPTTTVPSQRGFVLGFDELSNHAPVDYNIESRPAMDASECYPPRQVDMGNVDGFIHKFKQTSV